MRVYMGWSAICDNRLKICEKDFPILTIYFSNYIENHYLLQNLLGKIVVYERNLYRGIKQRFIPSIYKTKYIYHRMFIAFNTQNIVRIHHYKIVLEFQVMIFCYIKIKWATSWWLNASTLLLCGFLSLALKRWLTCSSLSIGTAVTECVCVCVENQSTNRDNKTVIYCFKEKSVFFYS